MEARLGSERRLRVAHVQQSDVLFAWLSLRTNREKGAGSESGQTRRERNVSLYEFHLAIVDAALGGKEFKFSLAEALKKGPVVLEFRSRRRRSPGSRLDPLIILR